MDSIFITQSEVDRESKDLSGHLTETNILNTIPTNSSDSPLENWEAAGKSEWRWRFMEFMNKNTVEISYKKPNEPRLYFNRHGEWIARDVPKIYDEYVTRQYYVYSSS